MKRRKRIIILISVAAGIVLLALAGKLLMGSVLRKHHISYTELSYRFPATLKVEGLVAAPAEGIYLEMARLEVGWKWGPLIRRKPVLTHFYADSGRILLDPGHEKKEGESIVKIPEFTLNHILLKQIGIDYYSMGDTMMLRLGELGITHASMADRLLLDSLLLEGTTFTYLQSSMDPSHETGKQTAPSAGSPFGSTPEFEIGTLTLRQCNFFWEGTEGSQHVQDLDLAVAGWKSSELLNVRVERLGFIYQDTLDMELVLENGALNQEFHTELADLEFHVPGISLNVPKAIADLKEGPGGNITLADSYFSLGWIRQFYPGIDSILHPSLPDTLRFYLNGGAALEGKQLFINAFMIRMLDSTSFVLSGSVDLAEEPCLAMRIDPLRSTRSNLVKLLAEESYHRFYLWPTDMDGFIRIDGPLDQLEITGTLNSREGLLQAESLIRTDTTGNLFFSLDIWSDSVQIDHITELLPMPVPHGQLRYYMELKESGQDPEGGSLWIRITSEHMVAFDHTIRDVEYNYFGDQAVDSMHAEVRDPLLDVVVDLVTPLSGDGTTYFYGDLNHLIPSAFQQSLPAGSVATRLRGNYLFGERVTSVGLDLDSIRLEDEDQIVLLPDSRFDLLGRGDRTSLRAKSGNQPFLIVETGNQFPPFSLPLPQWLNSWPDTEVNLHLKLEEEVVAFLTGSPGSMKMDTLRLVKDSSGWTTRVSIPQLQYQENHLKQFALELNSDRESLHGQWGIDSLYNASVRLDGITSTVGYKKDQYWFTLGNHGSDLLGSNRIGLVLSDLDSIYNLRLNDTVPLLVKDEEWQVELNRGVQLDQRFHLLGGDFGIRKGTARLEAGTSGNELQATIDSLSLDPLLAYFTDGELLTGKVNAQVAVNTKDMQTEVAAEVVAYNNYVPDPAVLNLEGRWAGESLSAHIDFSHNEASATADLVKNGEPYTYDLKLNRFDLNALQYIPGLTDQLEVAGMLTGEASGTLMPELNNSGYLVAEEVTMIPQMTGTPILLKNDTLILDGNSVLMHNFRVLDATGQELTLEGTINYLPELSLALHVKSDRFALLQERDKDAVIQGDLSAAADLSIRGRMDELAVTGILETLPGANIQYISEKSFNMVDASQIVTFMDLDNEDSIRFPVRTASAMKMDWDVNLIMDGATVEILLNEITQEYIRITSEGNLNLRSSRDKIPNVYGSLTSTSGRAYIIPPAVPDLDLNIESATIRWNGTLDNPVISFRGYKIVKGVTSGLSPEFEGNNQLVDYKVYVTLDRATLEKFDVQFDLEVEDSQAQVLLASLPRDTRQAYALNLLVFGRIGTEKIKGNDALAKQVTRKLNEISRRNLKNTGLSFSSTNYTDRSDGITERDRTDLNYSLSRGFLNNRLSVSVGGSVGFYMDDLTVLPPSSLIGDVELSYRLSDSPMLILKGTRKNVYEGIIDGMVMQESVGLTFQKSYPRFPLLLIGTKQEKEQSEQ